MKSIYGNEVYVKLPVDHIHQRIILIFCYDLLAWLPTGKLRIGNQLIFDLGLNRI